jgi:arylsulfatase A-like enzyme
MTAKSPAQLHLTDYIPGVELADKPLRSPDWQRYLSLTEKTMGEYFQEMGYETALFGKWHLSTDKQPPQSEAFNPNKQGFDHQMVTYKPVPGETNPEHDPHNVDSITQRGIRFLEAQTGERPFLMVLSHNSIHDPLMESEAAIERYRQKELPTDASGHAVWGAMVERLDGSVGRVMAALARLGLREHTLVIFYSDNGAKHAYAAQAPLRAGKGWLYEGGIRVPLIVNWPGIVPRATESGALITSMDLLPTLLSAVGKATPQLQEGRSFWAEAIGGPPVSNGPLFWHYPHYHLRSGMKPAAAIRANNWKMVEWYEASLTGQPGAFELYDLGQDPGEQTNLAAAYPDTLAYLQAELVAWRKKVGAQLPQKP